MLDVDRFKRVNDEHGHAVGDQVLRELAQRCKRRIRDVDILGRYGGEEFAMVLPDTDRDSAADTVARRLLESLGDEPIATRHGPLSVTVSLGVATAGDETQDLAALLDRADGAMYKAKAAGRNRVAVAEDEAEHRGGSSGHEEG